MSRQEDNNQFPLIDEHNRLGVAVGMSPVLDTGEMPPYFGRMMHDQTIDVQTVHDRAEVRSAALLEPFESSLTHVLSLAREAPVIQEPSPSQSLLEGLVVGHLGYLFDPESKRRAAENMVPLGVKAEPFATPSAPGAITSWRHFTA